MSDVRPPIEPMNDLAWARVERGLWARLDGTGPIAVSSRRKWLWIAAPSLAAAGAVAAVFALVVDTPNTSAPAVAHVDESPTRVVSGSSPSTVTVGEAHIMLDADSAVVMSPRANDTTAVLERGAARFAIAHREGKQFVVIAGDTVVRVVGTVFRVARSEERATVEVERGLVDVTFRGTTLQVGAGQSWSSEAPTVVGTALPHQTAQTEPAPSAPTSQPTGVEAPSERDQTIPAPKHKRITKTQAEPNNSTEPPRAKGTTTTPAPRDPNQARFEYFQAIEAKQYDAALAGYLQLARGTDQWAENALYAAARLAADHGDSARARTLLDVYLRRFPRGANAADARQLSDRLKGSP